MNASRISGSTHHESGTAGGITRRSTASSLLCFKGTTPPQNKGDGVSTYLALTFGTLLSSQGTDASIGTLSQAPPGASLRCPRHYQMNSDEISGLLPCRFPSKRWRPRSFRSSVMMLPR
ncbi:hypothetical protein E4198_16730 [Streptomyces sp. RKND-216]|nr:hypothetical protein E4198_16730 [Streptomyces sp. RKND-216]